MTDKTRTPSEEPPQARDARLPAGKTEAERRKERAAAKLRENLLRRKQQARARRAGRPDETEGLPAAKKDESS